MPGEGFALFWQGSATLVLVFHTLTCLHVPGVLVQPLALRPQKVTFLEKLSQFSSFA